MKRYRESGKERRIKLYNILIGVFTLCVFALTQYQEFKEEQTNQATAVELEANAIYKNHKQRIEAVLNLIESITGMAALIVSDKIDQDNISAIYQKPNVQVYRDYIKDINGRVYGIVDQNDNFHYSDKANEHLDSFIVESILDNHRTDYAWKVYRNNSNQRLEIISVKRIPAHDSYIIVSFTVPTQFRVTYDKGLQVFVVDAMGIGVNTNKGTDKIVHLSQGDEINKKELDQYAIANHGYKIESFLKLTRGEEVGISFYKFENDERKYWLKSLKVTDRWDLLVLINVDDAIDKIWDEPKEFYLTSILIIMGFILFHFVLHAYFTVRKTATKDKLTGLYNRVHFSDFIKTLDGLRARGKVSDISLIALDIDKFKNVNDTYGHNVGDEVLARLSQIMINNSRSNDFAYRLGGEEFTIICTEPAAPTAAYAEKLRYLIETDEVLLSLIDGGVTASFGVCEWSEGENIKTAQEEADRLLYKAKNNGRNQVQAQL